MGNLELKDRTKQFGIKIIRLVDALPRNCVADVLGRQILRSGTAVGANYRSACRARSLAEFVSRLAIVEEECDETLYWLELIQEAKLVNFEKIESMQKEADELTAIIVASIKTARRNKKRLAGEDRSILKSEKRQELVNRR